MPYKAGKRLGGERASKLGHLDIIKSGLVNKLIQKFENPEPEKVVSKATWEDINQDVVPLRLIFAIDGSKQTVRSDIPPYKEVSFVKTALLRLDHHAIGKLDQDAPHPLALRDLMTDSAMYHATVLPLKGIRIEGVNNYDAIRQIIYESLKDPSLGGEPYNTLKWLAYEKWEDGEMSSPGFECPHCAEEVPGLPYDSDEGVCEHCDGQLFLTDMIGFHLEMGEDSAPESVSTAYMLVHETLLLFTGIRFFWERRKYKVLQDALFIKDGPLTLRGQYSKLVIPIRRFLQYAHDQSTPVYICGQEKTGAFVDYFELISRQSPEKSAFVPSNDFIRREIQQRPDRSEPYGKRTNYGNKVLLKTDQYHQLVLSIPSGEYKDSTSLNDLIGAHKILATIPTLVSHHHECALVPVELANGVASLSSYPSAEILKIFADI